MWKELKDERYFDTPTVTLSPAGIRFGKTAKQMINFHKNMRVLYDYESKRVAFIPSETEGYRLIIYGGENAKHMSVSCASLMRTIGYSKLKSRKYRLNKETVNNEDGFVIDLDYQ